MLIIAATYGFVKHYFRFFSKNAKATYF